MTKFTKRALVYEEDITKIKGKVKTVVFPDSIEEIKNIIRLSDVDIVPRGSGVNFVGSTIPQNSIIIDMSKMKKIIEIDKVRKQAYIEAGVTIKELNQELEKYNLEFPVDPIFSEIRTIGGLIATNSSGYRELRYGKIKNMIDSLDILISNGEIITAIKSDVDDFAGLEGTTGIILRVKLRLIVKKTRSFSIIKSDSLEEILSIVKKLKFEHEISSLFLTNKKMSFLLGLENKYHLFIEFENNRGKIKEKIYEKFSNIKKDCYKICASNEYPYIENPKFLPEDLKEFLLLIEKKDIPVFSDAGVGSVFACFNSENTEIYRQATELIKKSKAVISYNFGIGLSKKEFLEKSEKELIKRIKLRRDPSGKFQNNKIIDCEKQKEKNIPIIEQKEGLIKADKEMEEFIEEQKIQEILEAKPLEKNIEEKIEKEEDNITLKKKAVLSEEEKEKIKKIAGGYF